MEDRGLVVQKFGGSSLRTKELRELAVRHIEKVVVEGKIPVVIVSAIGRDPDPYATDTLISVLSEENANVNLRELDLAVSCGEIISSTVLAANLQYYGYDAIALTGIQAGIKTNHNFAEGEIIDIDVNKIKPYINDGNIVVIAGFQGRADNGDIVTLGRGGSDTTATALASYLNAERVEIFTDVDGLMTVDPKQVPDARPIKVITFYEILQMAKEGVKVIHPRAVEYAMRETIPIYIKNTHKDQGENEYGTKITHHISKSSSSNEKKIITGIAHLPGITQITVELDYDSSLSLKVEVFNALANANISLDMINIYENKLTFTIRNHETSKTLQLLKDRGFGKIDHISNCTKITLFGARMTGLPGVMAKTLEILNKEGIEVLQTTDSNITISCLIMEDDTQRALRSLHEEFYLSR